MLRGVLRRVEGHARAPPLVEGLKLGWLVDRSASDADGVRCLRVGCKSYIGTRWFLGRHTGTAGVPLLSTKVVKTLCFSGGLSILGLLSSFWFRVFGLLQIITILALVLHSFNFFQVHFDFGECPVFLAVSDVHLQLLDVISNDFHVVIKPLDSGNHFVWFESHLAVSLLSF